MQRSRNAFKELLSVIEPVLIDACAFHVAMPVMFGGLSGWRDEGLLQSVLSRPQHLFLSVSLPLFDRAAQYAFGFL